MNKAKNLLIIGAAGLFSTLPVFGFVSSYGVMGPVAYYAQNVSGENAPFDLFWWLGDPLMSLGTRLNILVISLAVWVAVFLMILIVGFLIKQRRSVPEVK